MTMSALEAIRAEIPEVAKDLRSNLTAVLDGGALAPSERWGVAIAVALAIRSRRLAEALIASDPTLRRTLLGEQPATAAYSLRAGEREQVRQALAAAQGNRKKAAALLGVSRATLYRKLEQHDL